MTTFILLFIAGIFGGALLGMIGVGMALVAVPALTFPLSCRIWACRPGLRRPSRWQARWGS